MRTRVRLVTLAGAGAVLTSGLGLALAGPSSAAGAASARATVPAQRPGVSAAATFPGRTSAPVRTVAPGRVLPGRTVAPGRTSIQVPAGTAFTASRGGSGDDPGIVGLAAGGVLLVGAGTVVARRRA